MSTKKIASVSRKTFVLDTSVFVYDPQCWKNFKGNDVVIPITVLDELDKVKSFAGDAGRRARVAIRSLDALSNLGAIHNGIKVDDGITITINVEAYGAVGNDPTYGDNRILACASSIKTKNPKAPVILVSKDINLRVRAKAFGLSAEDYEADKTAPSDLYTGFREVTGCDEAGRALQVTGNILIEQHPALLDLNPNECVVFIGENGKGIATGRRVDDRIKIVRDQFPWDLRPRNKEQLFLCDLLLDPAIPLVTVCGLAGSGKTLCTIATGLDLVLNKRIYDTMNLYRPIQPMGNDVGFLPGSLEEKLDPWFIPIDDAFAFLCSDKSKNKDGWRAQLHQWVTNGTINKNALTYIRGRSIPNSLIILDEAQNISKAEIKTILTRVGMGSKIVLTGDIDQIDNNHLDASNNALTYVIEKFKSSPLSGHITLKKGERSELATVAAEIL